MLKTRVIPCLLLKDGRLVKTVQFKNPAYVGDPVNAIKIYNEKEVDELIVLDIGASARRQGPDFKLLGEFADECFMPLCYGGGVSTVEDIRRIFAIGIEKVSINSAAFEHPDLIRRAADQFGVQSIVVGMDVKRSLLGRYTVKTRCGTHDTEKDPVDYAREMQALGAGELLLYAIDRDGTWSGYDLSLLKKVTDAVDIPVIACGGAGSIDDFGKAAKIGGASAVAAGSMVVYSGKDLGVLINFPRRAKVEEVLA